MKTALLTTIKPWLHNYPTNKIFLRTESILLWPILSLIIARQHVERSYVIAGNKIDFY